MRVRWEFAYADLWLGGDKQIDDVVAAQAVIATYGEAGWEPVGEVKFEYREPNMVLSATTVVRQLMFKRPIDP